MSSFDFEKDLEVLLSAKTSEVYLGVSSNLHGTRRDVEKAMEAQSKFTELYDKFVSKYGSES